MPLDDAIDWNVMGPKYRERLMNPDIKERLTEQSIIAYRDHVIEECAQLVEEREGKYSETVAAIRDLKGEKT